MNRALATRGRWPAVLVSVAAAVLVTLPSVGNGFVYDDTWVIERHDVVHSLDTPGELVRAPYWPGGVIWRPVALVGYAVQWALGDGSPLIYHVTNVALYAAVSGLVAVLGATLFGWRLGMLAGVLFAVHPVHVEVTANSIGQAELLAALGYLIALVAAVARTRSAHSTARTGLLLAALGGVALGLGGKEHVVTIPGAVVVVWWLAARSEATTFRRTAQREWVVLVGFIALIGVYLTFRAQFAVSVTNAGGVHAAFEQRSALGRAIVMLPVSLLWLRLLFAPTRLSADYSIDHLVPQPVFGATHAVALLVWGALAFTVWRYREKVPAMFGGAALFAVMISVVSSVLVPLEILFAERFLFLPSLGWSIAAAGAVIAATTRATTPWRRTAWLGVGAVVVLFGFRSAQRSTVWRSNDVFFEQLLRDAPQSYRAHWAAGVYAFQRGDSVIGERGMREAVRINPNRADLLEQLGRVYAASGRHEPAVPLLSRALELDSTLLQSSLALAVSLGRSGRAAAGLEVLERASEIHGEAPGLLVVQGEVFRRAGQPLAALNVLQRVIEHEPGLWRVRLMAAEAAAMAGRCDDAYMQLDTALATVPPAGLADVEVLRSWVANGNAPCK